MTRVKWVLAVLALIGAVLAPLAAMAQQQSPADLRTAYQKGNYKDAYDGLAPQVIAAAGTDHLVDDFNLCINALNNLGRTDEVDDFREKAIAAHAKDWRFLLGAAISYRDTQHYGTIISGTFHRGTNRNGDGTWVSALERDRVHALQLFDQAVPLVEAEKNPPLTEAANFYYQFGETLLFGEEGVEAWRLQALTDLSKLPDYDDSAGPYYYRYYYNQPVRGAPVDENGEAILYAQPKGGWAAAKNDGERWRYMLMQASELSPVEAVHARLTWAQFLERQFGVETMRGYTDVLGRPGDKKNESGPYAVYSLPDGETIARLANGIRRFKLADEYNPIVQFKLVADAANSASVHAETAFDALGMIYQNRQQYDTAAEWIRRAIVRFGDPNATRSRQLDQIVGNWGRFENTLVQPAGDAGAKVDYTFRNGNKVSFTAQPVDVPQLLADVKAYIKAHPTQANGNVLDQSQMDIGDIGHKVLDENQQKYLGKEVARWDMPLKPRDKHFDDRVTIETPLKKPGAYWVVGEMANGNTTRIVLWITDTAIVQKPMQGKTLAYVADAITGKAIAGATVDFFGWRQVNVRDREFRIDTQSYTGTTNADGEIFTGVRSQSYQDPPPPFDPNDPAFSQNLNWLTTATTKDGRFAYMGFNSIWYGSYTDQYDYQYNQVKAFIMTDRPVYRPEQKVQFKMWVGNNKYDEDGKNPHAGESRSMEIRNPRGEIIKTVTGALDAYGGLEGDLTLGKNDPLGVYTITVPGINGSTTFRLEEYKKPEFEVTVDAPTEPVMLGDKITATINAKYYFGSPVVNATVKYKVTRTSYDARWYPAAYWDWYYEPGYWWFAADYMWYPGFSHWGMLRPIHTWWSGYWSSEQPEVISDGEAPIGPDGTMKINIDTAVAKATYGDRDHKYTISAEVTDASRRTITGTGDVLVARDPFKVYAWIDRGYYHAGDIAHVSLSAQTLDNKPVKGTGVLTLYSVTYDAANAPVEKEVQHWNLNTSDAGTAQQEVRMERAGQYRVSYKVTDAKSRTMEGGYVFLVRADGFDGRGFRFNDVEVTTDKQEYKAGEKVRLEINANRADATVLLFIRPSNGIYLEPKVLQLKGKSAVEEVDVGKKDMPNFFVEAMTISDAKVYTDVHEVIVPPEDRVLNMTVRADASEYKPGQKAKLTIDVTESNGEPFTGAAVLTLYDKAVEYISGGSNITDIRKFFWQWRRSHSANQQTSLDKSSYQILKSGETGMGDLGVFGNFATQYALDGEMRLTGGFFGVPAGAAGRGGGRGGAGGLGGGGPGGGGFGGGGGRGGEMGQLRAVSGPMPATAPAMAGAPAPDVQPSVRSNFADTALWAPALITATNGKASVEVTMPENLTTWKGRACAFGAGSRVGQSDTQVVTRKNLIVRMEAPRFFTQTDSVVLSAIVHNYLKTAKDVKVSIELAGTGLALEQDVPGGTPDMQRKEQTVHVNANGEARVDWVARATTEGSAQVTMKAITNEESDAMQMTFPVHVHGMLKTDSFAGALRPNPLNDLATVTAQVKLIVPKKRRPEQTLLEVQYSPSLASAMVDALPYMVDFPYGCTEQTLDRFVPTVVTQKILLDMHLDLAAIKAKRINLNAQELGDPATRAAADWQRDFPRLPANPVFDVALVRDMVRDGVSHLQNQQLSDGGWGWFSGTGEASYPHTTALVVHGLQIAKANDAAINAGVLERGVQWLKNYQDRQVAEIKAHRKDGAKAGDLDAFVYMVLVDAGQDNTEMRDYLFEDRNGLQVYTKAMFGLALDKVKDGAKLATILDNCKQFVVQDDENQTAYLKLPPNSWWYWYGSEYEAHAYYLKLLSRTDPKGTTTSRLAKYLINNRRNGTYWTNTRDTAICIEALADYVRASGEDRPDLTVHLALDGKLVKTAKITADNLFSFDNRYVLGGASLADGTHTLDISREGTGPLYYSAYLTNFTMEDHIAKAGLEIKMNRKVYLLTRDDQTVKSEGDRGQALDKRVEKYTRTELSEGQAVKSGDLVEVELTVDSKNDYEYIILEDMKAAGFEPVEVRSGYNGNSMRAYVEYRDDRVAFFVRELGRGTHSVSYRLRAEIPGTFSALPAKASAMYAPELKANSDEIRLRITDRNSPIK